VSELPVEWQTVRISDIGQLRYGRGLPTSHLSLSGFPVFGANGVIGFHHQYMYEGEQLLISCRGANSGTINISPKQSFVTNNSLVLELPPDLEHSRHFLKYALIAADKSRMVTGSAQPQVTIANAEGFELPFPPLAEQKRIVAKIDSLTGKSKRARDHLDHLPRLVEKYKQAVLAAAFRGDLTREWRADVAPNGVSVEALEDQRQAAWSSLPTRSRYDVPDEIEWRPDIGLPTGWAWASIDQLSYLIQYGTSAKTSDDEDGVAVLRMGNLQGGELDLSSLKYLPSDHQEFPELLLQSGDVLFNRTNSAELVGKTAVYIGQPDQASFASYLIRIKMSGLKPRLLSAYINSALGREWVASVVNQQVGQANVNGTKLRRLGVPVMSPNEQEEIQRRIETAFSWIDRLASEATSARNLIDRLDQAFLAKAFRGELVPQDPADEPASVLLERIRAGRGATPKMKRGRKGQVQTTTTAPSA
jgi:type I restriction enzyme S subunit